MYGIEGGGRKTEEEGRRSGFMPGRRYIELAKSGQRTTREGSGGTYGFRSVLRHFVPCVIEERIRPVAFLVDDTREDARVVRERRRRLSRKPLDASECRVLFQRMCMVFQHHNVMYLNSRTRPDLNGNYGYISVLVSIVSVEL